MSTTSSKPTPTRTWRCEKCGADQPAVGRQAAIMSLGDPTRRPCPQCGKKTTHRLNNRPAGTPTAQATEPTPAPATPTAPAPAVPGGSMEVGDAPAPTDNPPTIQEPNEDQTMPPTKSVTPRQPSVVEQAAAAATGTPCRACNGTGTTSKGKTCLPCNGTGQRQQAATRTTAAATAAPPAPARGGKSKGGKAAKPAPAPAPAPQPAGKGNGKLTPKALSVLSMLAGRASATKGEIWEECAAGSAILGAGSKEGTGGLLGDGLIVAQRHEGERQLVYSITPAGRKVLKSSE